MIVYPHGPTPETRDGIEVVPFQEFCSLLAAGSPGGAESTAVSRRVAEHDRENGL